MTDNNASDLSSLAYVDYGVSETLCYGPFHIALGDSTLITFTHARPKVAPQFGENKLDDVEHVVVARLIMSKGNVIALRDLLNSLLPSGQSDPGVPPTAAGGSTRVH